MTGPSLIFKKIIISRNGHSLLFVVTRCTTCYHSLSLIVTLCHSLSLVVTHCHSLSRIVPLVIPLVVVRCHALPFVVTRCTTRCHSMYHPSVFYKRSFFMTSKNKFSLWHICFLYLLRRKVFLKNIVMKLKIFFIIFDMEAQKCHQFSVQYF